MRQGLWGTETFVDFDHGLNTAVNKIREALGDSASVPRYVETIPGKGYRFLAPVSLQAPASEVSDEQGTAAAEGEDTATSTARVLPMAVTAGSAEAKESPGAMGLLSPTVLTAPDELPIASRMLVRTLLMLIQVMYLAFYLGALANLSEIHDIFLEASLPYPVTLLSLLITTGVALIPIRLFIVVAVALDFQNLPSKFGKLFPVLLVLDLLWAAAPFLLTHHISTGLALGLSAPLVYAPFAQRSLVLMYSRGR
jgi:cholera toxin transcriptional activator